MSLDWNVSKVRHSESVCFIGEGDDRRLRSLTESLIWASLATGIGTIKDSNVREVFARLSILEKLNGPFRRTVAGQPMFIDLADVQMHVGLYTNASFTDETRAAWIKRTIGAAMNDALWNEDRKARDAAERAKAAQATESAK